MRLANSDMEAEDRVSSLSIRSSVFENAYGERVFFMGFHKNDELIYFIGLMKQRAAWLTEKDIYIVVQNPVQYARKQAEQSWWIA